MPENGELDAGTYLVTAFTAPFEITVPDGWEISGYWALGKDPSGEGGVFLPFQSAAYVPTHACAWRDALVDVDPSAEAFVDAMAAQVLTSSTPPVEVVVGDYSGFEFDHAAESDVDITDCDGGKICIHSEMVHECNHWYSAVTNISATASPSPARFRWPD
ncbi:hypothetical protein [Arthrobacter sp. Br18]|uniref:hypothetical protein n=1 Tax=Arthrobacter sp. Br18 TaxID=1312954 RepID=UPI0004AD2DD8|nr:hypothetical protein [Arthrobacter sp. Br18]